MLHRLPQLPGLSFSSRIPSLKKKNETGTHSNSRTPGPWRPGPRRRCRPGAAPAGPCGSPGCWPTPRAKMRNRSPAPLFVTSSEQTLPRKPAARGPRCGSGTAAGLAGLSGPEGWPPLPGTKQAKPATLPTAEKILTYTTAVTLLLPFS